MAKYMVQGGPHCRRENGKWKDYKPGDVIEATEHELRNFPDKFKLVGPPDKPFDETRPPVKKLKMIHKGNKKYDVVNQESGKKINTRPLTKDEAHELLEDSKDMDE